MSDLMNVKYKLAAEWGEDIWPCITVTCPNNCGWKVRLHEKHVHFNLAGHLKDCHDGRP